ncbi:hypothetical protein [Tsukamurella soli]|uniref:Uncharacterized protein n=1 Tax=Tsukamurella soli TaxID=644556 RepID=A0ABP8JLQ7_9ACTN
MHARGRERIYRPRPDGLALMRRELESYWNQALITFKEVAEQTCSPKSTPEGNPES